MRVKAIRLQNFMGFTDTKWIELRPITLLYGWNSTGKSALVRALLLLRQSLWSERSSIEPLTFVADSGIDLGSFWRMIRGRDFYDESPSQHKQKGEPGEYTVRRQMCFGFRCEVGEEVSKILADLGVKPRHDDESYVEIELRYQFNEHVSPARVELSAVTLEAPFDRQGNSDGHREILQAEYLDVNGWDGWYLSSDFLEHEELYYPSDENLDKNQTGTAVAWLPNLDFNIEQGFLPRLCSIADSGAFDQQGNFKPVTDEMKIPTAEAKRREASWKIKSTFDHCCVLIKELFSEEKFRYIGPIRSAPRRTYLLSDLSQHKWDATGQAAIRDFLISYKEGGSAKQDELNIWLYALGIGKELHVKRLKLYEAQNDALTEAYQLGIAEGGETTDVNMRDVGFGVSQVLPIVLQALAAPDDGLVIIEQPELHMHPEGQAVLADLFISEAKNGRRFLIETHSEHLQLRLQLRIAGGEPRYLTSDDEEKYGDMSARKFEFAGRDLGVVFVTRDKEAGVTEVKYIEADPYGRLVGVTSEFSGFFDRDFLDSSVFSIEAESKAASAGEEAEK